MKIIVSISLLLSIFSTRIICQESNQKQDINDLGFEIDWSKSPEYSIDTLNFEDISVISEKWNLTLDKSTSPIWKYTVKRDLYPSDYIHSDSTVNLIDQFLNSTQNDLLENNIYELISSSECTVNNYFGKDYRWKTKDVNEFFKNRVFLIENAIYQLSVFSRTGESHNKLINEFLNSFVLPENLKGIHTKSKEDYKQTYTINFPQPPEYISKVIDSEIGKLTMQMQMVEPENVMLNMLYMASEVKYPSNTINTANKYEYNNFLIKSINGSVNAVNGELISILDIEHGIMSGKEFKMYISNGKIILKYQMFYINDTLYTLGVMSDAMKDENDKMSTFFKSFKLKN